MNSTKLSELVEALELDSDEAADYVDLQTGRVVRVWHSLLSAVEEGEDDGDSLADWEPEEVEEAKAIAAGLGERFVPLPSKFDFHEYRQMERFIGTVQDGDAAEQLGRAIEGKGAFRHFRNTADRFGLLQQWYKFRENAMKEFLRDWAEAYQIPIMDDTNP